MSLTLRSRSVASTTVLLMSVSSEAPAAVIHRRGRRALRNGSSALELHGNHGHHAWSRHAASPREPFPRAARLGGRRRVTISKDAFETRVLAILGPLHGVARRLTKNDADAE